MKTFLILIACAFCGFVVANRRNSLNYEFQNRSANSLVSQSEGDAGITSTQSKNRVSSRHSQESEEDRTIWSVYTIGEHDSANVDAACRTINRVFTFGTCVKGHRRLPETCIKQNNELDGNQCLSELRRDGEHCVYITNQMVYSEDLSVRGLTNLYGSVILVKNNPHFEKVLIHEMGHVLGLRHCENLACVMAIHNDAEGTEKFCEQCIRLVPEGSLRNRKASTLDESEELVSVAEGELDELN
jgi:hypothetical protein